MRVLIAVDMEGISGVTHWDHVKPGHYEYTRFREIMTEEVNAAIDGALDGGATSIVVTDGHSDGRNILIEKLHAPARLNSGSPAPLSMVEGVPTPIASSSSAITRGPARPKPFCATPGPIRSRRVWLNRAGSRRDWLECSGVWIVWCARRDDHGRSGGDPGSDGAARPDRNGGGEDGQRSHVGGMQSDRGNAHRDPSHGGARHGAAGRTL